MLWLDESASGSFTPDVALLTPILRELMQQQLDFVLLTREDWSTSPTPALVLIDAQHFNPQHRGEIPHAIRTRRRGAANAAPAFSCRGNKASWLLDARQFSEHLTPFAISSAASLGDAAAMRKRFYSALATSLLHADS